jgi:urease accessory protein
MVGLALAAVLVPATGFAHPGHESVSGIMVGLMHPWTGLDHVAAMLAVGLWATRMHKPSKLALLGATAVGIVTGTFLGSYPDLLTYGETITVVSVMAFGFFAAVAGNVRKPFAAILVALLSVFHGYVHTAEIPHQSSHLAFSSGFLISMLASATAGNGNWNRSRAVWPLIRHAQPNSNFPGVTYVEARRFSRSVSGDVRCRGRR